MKMKSRAQNEKERIVLQSELDEKKSSKERNKLGQFATPLPLAEDMLGYSLGLLDKNQPIRFLDPAIGTGAFYSALLQAIPKSRIKESLGFEIDPHYGNPAKQLWETSGIRIEIGDFTREIPPHESPELFNLIVCNPPYVRHHHISRDEKTRLQKVAIASAGIRVGGLAGLYCYFVAISHQWMAQDGVAAWIVPSEFLDVNYGIAIKQYLLSKVTLLRIHRFEPSDIQFDDALVTSAVLWIRKTAPSPNHVVNFTYGGPLVSPRKSKSIPIGRLRPEEKWSGIPNDSLHKRTPTPSLGDFFDVKRGIATGANSFFIIGEEKIQELGLPRACLRPVLPGPRVVTGKEILADAFGNPLLEPKLFVLDCNLPEREIQHTYPALWRYLGDGKEEVANRYLCRHRHLWYSQEMREPAPYICTYIGRTRGRNSKPFRFILNHSKAIVTNVYLMLYPKEQVRGRIALDPSAKRDILAILNNISGQMLKHEGRVYGGGMHKLEPKELGKVPAKELSAYLHDTSQPGLFTRERSG